MKEPDFRQDILPMRDALLRAAMAITHDNEEAEDVVQDTMLKVWSQRGNWQQIDNIRAYCMATCRHIALDRVKSPRHATLPLPDNCTAPSHYPTASQRLEAEDTRLTIEAAFQALPDIQQRIMALREQREMSYDQIADELGVSMTQVKVYLMRARNRIRKAIENNI